MLTVVRCPTIVTKRVDYDQPWTTEQMNCMLKYGQIPQFTLAFLVHGQLSQTFYTLRGVTLHNPRSSYHYPGVSFLFRSQDILLAPHLLIPPHPIILCRRHLAERQSARAPPPLLFYLYTIDQSSDTMNGLESNSRFVEKHP